MSLKINQIYLFCDQEFTLNGHELTNSGTLLNTNILQQNKYSSLHYNKEKLHRAKGGNKFDFIKCLRCGIRDDICGILLTRNQAKTEKSEMNKGIWLGLGVYLSFQT